MVGGFCLLSNRRNYYDFYFPFIFDGEIWKEKFYSKDFDNIFAICLYGDGELFI